MPSSSASEIWRRECEVINQEMEHLILSDWPRSQEENQVRKVQFMALVERRSEAARRFLADAAARPRFGSAKDGKSRSTDRDDITAESRAVPPANDDPDAAPHVKDDDLTRRVTLLKQ